MTLKKQQVKEVGVFQTKTHLSLLFEKVQKGERFFITKRGKRVAELRPVDEEKKDMERGCVQNSGYWMAPDFDETPEDFEEYMD